MRGRWPRAAAVVVSVVVVVMKCSPAGPHLRTPLPMLVLTTGPLSQCWEDLIPLSASGSPLQHWDPPRGPSGAPPWGSRGPNRPSRADPADLRRARGEGLDLRYTRHRLAHLLGRVGEVLKLTGKIAVVG